MAGLALISNFVPSLAWWPTDAIYAADFTRGYYMKSGMHVAQSAAFTFTRASEKLAETLSGEWKLFPSDVAAITDQGLFCEPEETFYPVNSLFEGATPGTLGAGGALPANWTVLVSGGLSIEVVHTGMAGDAPYIRLRIFGTTTGTDFQIALNGSAETASAGETWSAGLSVRHVAGSTTGMTAHVRIVEETGGSYVNATTQPIGWGGTFQRKVVSRSFDGVATDNVGARLRISVPDATAIDVTADLLLPALVKNAVVGSPMLTGQAGQIGRADDNATVLLPTSVSGQLTLHLADDTSLGFAAIEGTWPVPTALLVPIGTMQFS